MADLAILEPVSEDDPCGPDLRYDAEHLFLLSALQSEDDVGAVAGGELAETGGVNRAEIVDRAGGMLAKSKDLGIAAVRAEASWQGSGLGAFADAMEGLVAMAQAWPDGAAGVHPRADEDDGDLGERAAPVGRLLNSIPLMVRTIGWGEQQTGVDERSETYEKLRGVFESWTERMAPALGDSLPGANQVWAALSELAKPGAPPELVGDEPAGAAPAPGAARAPVGGDAWDLVDRAAEAMARQDRHSPALPVLRLVATWRSQGLGEIARAMKMSGVGLELLVESIEKQLGGGIPGMPGQ